MKNKSVKRELNPIQQSLFETQGYYAGGSTSFICPHSWYWKIKSQEAQQAVAAEIQLQIEQAQLRRKS